MSHIRILALSFFVLFSSLTCSRAPNLAGISVSIMGESLSADTTSFSVGLVAENAELDPIDVSVTNSGSTDLSITNLILQALGNSRDEEFQFENAELPTIPPGETFQYHLDFKPESEGEKSANVIIVSTAADRPHSEVNLHGHTEWGSLFLTSTTGLNKNSLATAERPHLVAHANTIYATWEEGTGAAQIRVAAFTGTTENPSWTFVDGNGVTGLNKNSDRDAGNPRLHPFQDKLYLSWDERGSSGLGRQIRLARYASESWTFLDGNGVTGLNYSTLEDASHPELVSFSNKIYLFWSEDSDAGFRIRARSFNPEDESWVAVDGGGLAKLSTRDARKPTAYVFNGKLYASWYEEAASFNSIRIAVYNSNDSSPAWTYIDGNLGRDDHSARPQLLSLGDTLYLAYHQRSENRYRVRVAAYNGDDSSPSWTFIDNGELNQSSSESATTPQLLGFRKKLYAIWSETSSNSDRNIRIKHFNGKLDSPLWYGVDGTSGIDYTSSNQAVDPQIVSLNGRIFAIWREADANHSRIFSSVANH